MFSPKEAGMRSQRMKDAEAKALALRKEFMVISRRSPSSTRPALQTKYEADHRALAEHDPLMELINSPAADIFTVGEPDQSKLVPEFHRRSFVDDICFGGLRSTSAWRHSTCSWPDSPTVGSVSGSRRAYSCNIKWTSSHTK
ncbi:unnamed protein product [Phytophthora fragariaefolia]|uniref:Unnamed protein product n=1 Tax=Phytophthora fragariaefolia TaxID=1490495 RepID=A0A9W6Y523_9STRA|nr:unnamed protein product [Phytophthora fragariaefolia]